MNVKEKVRRGAELSNSAYEQKPTIESVKTDTQLITYETARYLFVAFRGTSSKKDIEQDLKRIQEDEGYGDVHMGFEQCLDSVWPTLLHLIKSKGKSVIFTGHSLGGALAQLASVKYGEYCGCITFGSPKVGDARFVTRLEHIGGVLRLFEHRFDKVPLVPYFGYSKPKKKFVSKVCNWRWWGFPTVWAHSMDNYQSLVDKT